MQPRKPTALALFTGLGLTACLCAVPANAEQPKLTIELNKLEPQDKNCRAYFVVGNDTTIEYETLRLDLVLFQPDGIIGRRLAVNLAPLKAAKKVVKQFDLEGLGCDQIGSLLINDVLECKVTGGAATDCLAGLAVTSLTKVQLSK
ncbi:MAG: hypothetical protein ABL894_11880 [Hyphomicrobium sp.]